MEKTVHGFPIYPHRREDFITKKTRVAPEGDCPLWLDFIEFVSNGDKQLARYLQVLCGYALVGDRSEQMFAFIHGGGNNGKSVFLQTIQWVLGSYAVTVDASVFMWSPHQRHPEELMPLRGARLVVASEVPPDARWNEARIKAVTGGEIIRARGMHQNSIEFPVQALLIMAGNEKPHLKSVDIAIRRRIHLIPFVATVSEDQRDKHLATRLQEQGGGILKWMFEGCRIWQAEGLIRPNAVEQATEDYLEDEDTVKQWVLECCHISDLTRTRTVILYNNWKSWAEAQGLKPIDVTRFSSKLTTLGKTMGFERAHRGDFRGFFRITIK